MTNFDAKPDFRHGQDSSLGILLVNLGTPDEPTTKAVRRYLKAFLSDPRVVEVPRPIWWLILNLYILRVRPAESAKAYRTIWTESGSPLLLHSRKLAETLEEKLSDDLSGNVHVELAMSYGNPSIPDALARLYEKQAERILILPLYPQYSGTTTGTVFEAVMKQIGQRRWIPETRFINHYHDDPGYIAALASSIQRHWDASGRGERLLFSFHGIPKSLVLAGDPYQCQALKTARLVAESLELERHQWEISFQSRVGREEWLRPYTDELLEKWGHDGVGDIDVASPGFAVDCLETLEEVAIRYGELFTESGGGKLRYIPALNSSDEHINLLFNLIEQNLGGWPEAGIATDRSKELALSAQRARERGAEQ